MRPFTFLMLLSMFVPVAAQDISSMDPNELAARALTEGTAFLDASEILAWVDLPRSAKKGETITLRITVENARVDGDFSVESLDLDSSFLSGFQIKSISPTLAETDESFGSLSMEYPMTVSAGETVEFLIELLAIEKGVYVGEVSIWNTNLDFLSRYVQCKIVE